MVSHKYPLYMDRNHKVVLVYTCVRAIFATTALSTAQLCGANENCYYEYEADVVMCGWAFGRAGGGGGATIVLYLFAAFSDLQNLRCPSSLASHQ